ncbi:MAG: hypothetical protein R3F49_08490 [Planctomycetota bacterium]
MAPISSLVIMRLVAYPLLVLALASCQSSSFLDRKTNFGGEVQVYPTGLFLGPRAELELNERDSVHARAAVHFADRGSAGEHDDEQGSGWGGGLGYRRWLDTYGKDWSVGGRLDLWRLSLDWRDNSPTRSGNTDVTVLVPSVEGGYSWPMDGGGRVDLNLGLGYEFNLDTDGADVGQGAILMFGVSFSGGTRGIRRLHERHNERMRERIIAPEESRDTVSMLGLY